MLGKIIKLVGKLSKNEKQKKNAIEENCYIEKNTEFQSKNVHPLGFRLVSPQSLGLSHSGS